MELIVAVFALGTLVSFPVLFAFLIMDAIRARKSPATPVSGR